MRSTIGSTQPRGIVSRHQRLLLVEHGQPLHDVDADPRRLELRVVGSRTSEVLVNRPLPRSEPTLEMGYAQGLKKVHPDVGRHQPASIGARLEQHVFPKVGEPWDMFAQIDLCDILEDWAEQWIVEKRSVKGSHKANDVVAVADVMYCCSVSHRVSPFSRWAPSVNYSAAFTISRVRNQARFGISVINSPSTLRSRRRLIDPAMRPAWTLA